MKKIYHLSERQNHRCCYCGHHMIDIEEHHIPYIPHNAMTKEHVVPKSHGGIAVPENLVAACSLCNYLRGNMDYTAFHNLIRKWFKRDETLWERWHYITREEKHQFKMRCVLNQGHHLRHLARRSKLHYHRFERFMHSYGERIQLRA